MIVGLRTSFNRTVVYQKRVMLSPPFPFYLWLPERFIVPDSFEVFENLYAVFVLGGCEAEGVAGPYSEEEGALQGVEDMGEHGGDIVGFSRGPD